MIFHARAARRKAWGVAKLQQVARKLCPLLSGKFFLLNLPESGALTQLREIERLQEQVTKLQTSPRSQSLRLDVVTSPVTTIPSGPVDGLTDGPCFWKGIQVRMHSTSRYFGPSSTYAFLGRTLAFLNSASEETMEINQLVPEIRSERRALPNPTLQSTQMQFSQEQLFLNLFWETFHSLTPILAEDDFRAHYMALWTGDERQASPLVDILLALCIQYGRNFVGDENMEDGISRFYFERCRHQLAELWEYPSMEMVQSYIFMVIYLLNSAEFTSARSVLVQAVNVAYVLGLHFKHSTPGQYQDDCGSRAWNKLFVLDVKLSIELGLPPCINLNDAQQNISNKSSESEPLADRFIGRSVGDKVWVAEEFKLFEAARIAHTQFFSGKLGTRHIYTDAKELERLAELMTRCLENIHAWYRQLLGHSEIALQIYKSVSISPPSSVLDTSTPFGMQLQQIFLKLEYHQICLSFHRLFFIYFTPQWTAVSPKANTQASSALNHAIAITNILHQSLTTSITLNGFYPAYNFQWAAAVTIMTFILAYPICQPTPSARNALPVAIKVLEMLGKHNPLALEAVAILNRLNSSSKALMATFSSTLGSFKVIPDPDTSVILEIPVDTDADLNVLWSEADHYQYGMWTEFVNGLDTAQPFVQYDGDFGYLNAS